MADSVWQKWKSTTRVCIYHREVKSGVKSHPATDNIHITTIMAPSIVSTTPASITDLKLHVKSGHTTAAEALEAAKSRFVARNATSLKLHQEALKSLPGGNTRSLLHTAPFPVFLKKGEGYKVVSEDGHT